MATCSKAGTGEAAAGPVAGDGDAAAPGGPAEVAAEMRVWEVKEGVTERAEGERSAEPVGAGEDSEWDEAGDSDGDNAKDSDWVLEGAEDSDEDVVELIAPAPSAARLEAGSSAGEPATGAAVAPDASTWVAQGGAALAQPPSSVRPQPCSTPGVSRPAQGTHPVGHMGASHRNGQAAIHAQASPSRQAAIGGHTPSPSQLPHSHTPHPQQGAVTRQPLIGQFAQPHTGRRKKGKGKGTPGAARRSEQPDTTPPSAGAQPLPATTPQATPSLPPACHPLPSHNQDGELRTVSLPRPTQASLPCHPPIPPLAPHQTVAADAPSAMEIEPAVEEGSLASRKQAYIPPQRRSPPPASLSPSGPQPPTQARSHDASTAPAAHTPAPTSPGEATELACHPDACPALATVPLVVPSSPTPAHPAVAPPPRPLPCPPQTHGPPPTWATDLGQGPIEEAVVGADSSESTMPVPPHDTAVPTGGLAVTCPTCRSTLVSSHALALHAPHCQPADALRRAEALQDATSSPPSFSEPRASIGESFRRALAAEDPAGIDPHIATALADLPPSVRALLPPLSSCISSAPDGLFSEFRRAASTQRGVAATRRVQEKIRDWRSALVGVQPEPMFYACVAETFGHLSVPLRDFLGLCSQRIATQRRDAGSGEEASARIFECALTTRVSVALQRAQANIITQHAVRQLGESDDAWMPIPRGVAATRRVQEKIRDWRPALVGVQPEPMFYACVAETFGHLSVPLRDFLGLCSQRIATQRRDAGSGEEASARIFEAGRHPCAG
ncbi:hypothetical protein CLOP_g20928 [Closterium sp. NIES-67]|nr:hypothetical protein CLOP_g20928 [Closterium sp. NIES-67]